MFLLERIIVVFESFGEIAYDVSYPLQKFAKSVCSEVCNVRSRIVRWLYLVDSAYSSSS